ncbi:9216_t:CDS:2, partial [Funneliformis geosporum]
QTILQTTKITEAFPEGLQYKKPKPLVSSHGSNWQYQSDPKLKKILRKHTESHYMHFVNENDDKIDRPTYLFFSGAGTGKSRNASEFHNMLIQSLKDSNNLELKNMIQDAWVFNISLENGTSFSRSIERFDILAIGVRMFWQVYTGDDDFDRFLFTYDAPTPLEVIRWIAKGHNKEKEDMKKTAIILVVDGLQNFMTSNDDGLDEDSAFYQTLSKISDLALNNDFFLIPCCTATITRSFDQTIKSSNRLRVRLPVVSLNPPTIFRDNKYISVFQDHHIINLLVDDCGGHGRALEVLAETIGDKNINDCNFDQLMHDLRASLEDRYPSVLNISALEAQAIVRAILTRIRLDSRKCVPCTDKLPDYFVQPGLIRFEKIGTSAEGYFNAPYIWIWIMAQPSTLGGDPLLRDWQFCDYGEHVATFDRRRIPGAQLWDHFEYFVAIFRYLKSRVLEEGQKTTISEIHTGARLRLEYDITFTNHHLKLEHAKHQEVTNSSKYTKTRKIICEDSVVNVREGKYCIINGGSAPHGDSFLSLDQSRKNNPNEVHQAKKWKTSRINRKLYYDEREKSAGDRDFFILFTTGESDNFDLPENSGIVDKSNWNNYFGPFAGRAYNYAIVGALDINTATTTELMTVYDLGE